MHETFGPEYVRPAQRDCPRCSCCTEELCERGRSSRMRCHGQQIPEETRELVFSCPCSAATTRHTAAWRAAQVRVTRMALEVPLPAEVEALLRALADGQAADDGGMMAQFAQLKTRGLAQVLLGAPAITELGWTYLRGRDDARAPASVRVLDVDLNARTARVECAAWRQGEPVTVLLDQILGESGLDVGSLPGRWLTADANCHTQDVDSLVFTRFRAAAPVPPNWMQVDGGDEHE